MVLPRPASRFVAPDVSAQLGTPTIPDIIPTLEPSPSPSPSETGGGGGGGGSGGGGGGSGGGGEDPKEDEGDENQDGRDGPGGSDSTDRKGARGKGSIFTGVPSIPGSFNTDDLVAVAAQLRSLGWNQQQVIERVYPPFIIAGPSVWTDTWGAPRYGPGPIVRTHEGQDVFCEFGDPVLASEDGFVTFDDQGLGGLIARLHREDGSYFYYAHLSDWNQELRNGDRVSRGEVLGYCGNSGNALTTPPHVHFGWYKAQGSAKDPMRQLVRWLREAESRALALVGKAQGKRVREISRITAARRFGDAFVPDRSELAVPTESLWASGSSPATGAFGLAETALQAALANHPFFVDGGLEVTFEAQQHATAFDSLLDPNSDLAAILRESNLDGELSD
jgi:murein DD-endopeptidase MepM/ murein hydrolase activator NlpD